MSGSKTSPCQHLRAMRTCSRLTISSSSHTHYSPLALHSGVEDWLTFKVGPGTTCGRLAARPSRILSSRTLKLPTSSNSANRKQTPQQTTCLDSVEHLEEAVAVLAVVAGVDLVEVPVEVGVLALQLSVLEANFFSRTRWIWRCCFIRPSRPGFWYAQYSRRVCAVLIEFQKWASSSTKSRTRCSASRSIPRSPTSTHRSTSRTRRPSARSTRSAVP